MYIHFLPPIFEIKLTDVTTRSAADEDFQIDAAFLNSDFDTSRIDMAELSDDEVVQLYDSINQFTSDCKMTSISKSRYEELEAKERELESLKNKLKNL